MESNALIILFIMVHPGKKGIHTVPTIIDTKGWSVEQDPSLLEHWEEMLGNKLLNFLKFFVFILSVFCSIPFTS